jgi:hypothetical protein
MTYNTNQEKSKNMNIKNQMFRLTYKAKEIDQVGARKNK